MWYWPPQVSHFKLLLWRALFSIYMLALGHIIHMHNISLPFYMADTQIYLSCNPANSFIEIGLGQLRTLRSRCLLTLVKYEQSWDPATCMYNCFLKQLQSRQALCEKGWIKIPCHYIIHLVSKNDGTWQQFPFSSDLDQTVFFQSYHCAQRGVHMVKAGPFMPWQGGI